MTEYEISRVRAIRNQVDVTIETMRSLSLTDPQMSCLKALLSHITDAANEVIAIHEGKK